MSKSPKHVSIRFGRCLSGIALFIFTSCAAADQASGADNVTMLRTLEHLCQKARDAERQEIQRRIVQVCLKKGRSEERCTQEAKQYGNINIRSVDPSAEIPVCKQAGEYRKSLDAKQ